MTVEVYYLIILHESIGQSVLVYQSSN